MREQLTGDDIDELFLSLIDAPDFPPSSPSSSAETADLPVACDLAELADLPDLPDASTAAGAGNSGISGSSASSSGEELNATDELPLAVDEETRRLRRMARNRRAAAVSRQRKKEHVEALQAQLDVLRAENEQLRQRLSDAGLPCETDVHQQHSQQQPLLQQPEALWNRSLQLEFPQLLPAVTMFFFLALLLRSKILQQSVSSVPSVSTHAPLCSLLIEAANSPLSSCALPARHTSCLSPLERRRTCCVTPAGT